jgi:16S rRNA (guanine527-N7)-methyltransferase
MQLIEKYFPELNPRQFLLFSSLYPLYSLWNQRINVISRKDIEQLYLHHVLHSLSITGVIQFKPGTIIIDAGTGGGFPGIPLAILYPEVHFILTDSIRKKIHVVNEIIRETGLTNCETRNLRLEDLKDKADFIVSRAVAEVPLLWGWTRKNIIPGGIHNLKNGLLAFKGGDLSRETADIGANVRIFNLIDYFPEPFFETKKLVYIPR